MNDRNALATAHMDPESSPGVAERTLPERRNERKLPKRVLSRRIQEKAAGMPETMRKGYLQAAQGTGSPRTAIKAFCLECVGYVRAEVAQCTAAACPLFMYRPFQCAGASGTSGDDGPKAINPAKRGARCASVSPE